MLRLDLGAGNQKTPGYISVDKYDREADVQADITNLPYEDESVDHIVCYQVIEHIPYQQSTQVFEEMYRVMKSGAKAIIETVDFDVVARGILRDGLLDKWIYNIYGQYYRPHDKSRYEDWENNAASIHRNPWNKQRVQKIADDLGFTVRFQSMDEKHPLYKYEENLSFELTKD